MISILSIAPSGSVTPPQLRLPPRSGGYRLLCLGFNLACDATAGTRVPVLSLEVIPGTKTFQIADAVNTKLTAGLSADMCFFPGANPTVGTLPLPQDGYYVPQGLSVRVDITAMQAGDVVSNVFALIQDAE